MGCALQTIMSDVNLVNLAEAKELEFLYFRDYDQTGKKKLSWSRVLQDSIAAWKAHSVRREFPITNLKVSVHSEDGFEVNEQIENLLAEDGIEMEFSALPLDHYILVGKKRGITTDVSPTDDSR